MPETIESNAMILTERAERILDLADEATPGPWEACRPGDYADFDRRGIVVLGDDKRVAVFYEKSDADAVVAARNDAPLIRDLLAENARLRAHAEAMAKVWADDFTEEDMTEAVLNYRSAFPETSEP